VVFLALMIAASLVCRHGKTKIQRTAGIASKNKNIANDLERTEQEFG